MRFDRWCRASAAGVTRRAERILRFGSVGSGRPARVLVHAQAATAPTMPPRDRARRVIGSFVWHARTRYGVEWGGMDRACGGPVEPGPAVLRSVGRRRRGGASKFRAAAGADSAWIPDGDASRFPTATRRCRGAIRVVRRGARAAPRRGPRFTSATARASSPTLPQARGLMAVSRSQGRGDVANPLRRGRRQHWGESFVDRSLVWIKLDS